MIALLPEFSATLQDQLVVPDAVTVLPVAAFAHVTCVTPTLSDALPPSPTGVLLVLYVVDEVGLVIVTVGDVPSGGV